MMTPDREKEIRALPQRFHDFVHFKLPGQKGPTDREIYDALNDLITENDRLRVENKKQSYVIEMGSKDLATIRQLFEQKKIAIDALNQLRLRATGVSVGIIRNALDQLGEK
jgi:hypothetical protein